MKLCYTLILIFTEILIAFTIFRVLYVKNGNLALSQKILDLLIVSFFTIFPNIFIPHVTSELMATIFFSWYFCFIDMLLFLLLYFSVEYSFSSASASRRWYKAFYLFFRYDLAAFFHGKKQRTTSFEKFMLVFFLLIVADIVQFALNIFTHAVFSVESFYSEGVVFAPDIYYRIVSYFPYDVHLSLSYALVLLTLLCLVKKTIISPELYRIKYLASLILISIVVIVNSFYVLFEIPLDFSVILYGLVCVSIYYFSFKYVPKYLQRKSIGCVIENMNSGILIFDIDDRCIFINDCIRKLCEVKANQDPEIAMRSFINKFSDGQNFSSREPCEMIRCVKIKDKTVYYRVIFSRIEDKDGKFLGSYFLLIDISEERNRERQEHFRSTHDQLTGLYNKEYFCNKVAEALEANPDKEYCIVCSDIGNFKLINEIYGVAVGDQILKLMALKLREKAVSGELYGRIDNDRFAIFIPKENLDIQTLIDITDSIFKNSLDLTMMTLCYFGVYEIKDTDVRVSFMCDRAFIAINTIKGQMGKQVAWYDATLRNDVLREQELIYQLSDAIAAEQIKIYLQPRSLADGTPIGAEALVRWEHPGEGLILPNDFVPLFEKNGMITKIDRCVWRLVFEKLAEWKNAGRDDFYISVNVSCNDFYLMDIQQELSDLLSEFKINPKNFHVKISEVAIMMDFDKHVKFIKQLRGLGFIIEIGDFGANYSSLKILRECDIEILKLDIGFLIDPNFSRNSHIIMKQLVEMAHRLGTKIVVKGIEYKEQVELLSTYGCDFFEGYYFSKPIEISMFEKIYL